MITATSVRRLMRLQATLTTVSLSTTEVDEMNQPVEVTTTSVICCSARASARSWLNTTRRRR